MTITRHFEPAHSTASRRALKHALLVWLVVAPVVAQTTRPQASGRLREELTGLLAAGELDQAVHRAQEALRASPSDPQVRAEYVNLHLTLAQTWLADRQFDAADTALDAVLAVEPRHEVATRLRAEIHAARERAGSQTAEIDRRLRLELFGSALDLIHEVDGLRPDLAASLRAQRLAALRGVADDHYLARNFNEAFALYEKLLSADANSAPTLGPRWALALTLALAESDFSQSPDPEAFGRLSTRVTEVVGRTGEPILGQILRGMLAERTGDLLAAGRAYSQALGETWQLPPTDRRAEATRQLRERAVLQARDLYESTPVGRREGFWSITLPDVWKHRQTPHCDVYARNDVIAERVAEAAEYHLAGIGDWLGCQLATTWEPRCEIRVHADRDSLHAATSTQGLTSAVSHTRFAGERVVGRKLDLFQADPWLLSSTLPHELTHLVLADLTGPRGLPLAIDEGLALHAEPSARKLMYRRRLPAAAPTPDELLATSRTPADIESFYAQAGTLVDWLLDHIDDATTAGSAPVRRLIELFKEQPGVDRVWSALSIEDEAARRQSWEERYAARRNPYRMPLMILVEPSSRASTQ